MSYGEGFGVAVFAAGLLTFVGVVGAAVTRTLDDAIVWMLGDQLVATLQAGLVTVAVVAGVAVVGRAQSRSGKLRIYIRPHRDHAHGVAGVRDYIAQVSIPHEALGHAAVGAAVRGSTSGIRARVHPDGSGWCEVPRGRMTLAESIAITRAGEYVAGPSGCASDRARGARELRQAPRRYRAQVSAEADRLVAQHANSAFGRRVARALERNGRFR